MYREANIFSSFSVDNIEEAKTFYGKVLGLAVSDDQSMAGIFKIRLKTNHEIIVYSKSDHVPATFT